MSGLERAGRRLTTEEKGVVDSWPHRDDDNCRPYSFDDDCDDLVATPGVGVVRLTEEGETPINTTAGVGSIPSCIGPCRRRDAWELRG